VPGFTKQGIDQVMVFIYQPGLDSTAVGDIIYQGIFWLRQNTVLPGSLVKSSGGTSRISKNFRKLTYLIGK
jgi:hypothetical protein